MEAYKRSCNTPTGSLINNVNIVSDPKFCPTKHGRVYCKTNDKIGYECIGSVKVKATPSK